MGLSEMSFSEKARNSITKIDNLLSFCYFTLQQYSFQEVAKLVQW